MCYLLSEAKMSRSTKVPFDPNNPLHQWLEAVFHGRWASLPYIPEPAAPRNKGKGYKTSCQRPETSGAL